MRHIIAGLLLASVPVCALAVDARALARFDTGYAKCELLYPQMAGHRDEAYLGLWRTQVNAKSRAGLAAARQGKAYKVEHKRAAANLEKNQSAEVDKRLAHQCQATWGQTKLEAPARAASQ